MQANVRKNYIYNVIYQLVTILTPLITTPYVSRVLTPDGVGRASFTTSLITYFVVFAALGFALYGQREIAKNNGNKYEQTKIFWEINILRLFSMAIALSLNLLLLISNVYVGNSTLMLILSINIISVAFDISFIFQGNEDFGKLASVNIISKLLMTAAIFIFVKTINDVWIYVLISSVGYFLGYVGMWPFLGKVICRIKAKELKPFRHLRGTLVLFIPALTVTIYTVLDKSMIGFITNSNAENGIYEQAMKIARSALLVVTCMGAVMIPRNSKNYAEKNLEAVKQNIYKTTHFVWVLGIPMFLGFVAIASNLVPWFLGADFSGSIILLQILSSLIIIVGFSNVLGVQYLLPTMQDKNYTMAIAGGAISNICINIPFIYLWGALGASIATIISEIVVCAVMYYLVRKEISLKEMFKTIKKPLFAGIIMFGIVFSLSHLLAPGILNTFIIIFVGIAVYAAMIFSLKDELVMDVSRQIIYKVFKKNGK